jgi:NitT/TauT family transport system ATP-binding protein
MAELHVNNVSKAYRSRRMFASNSTVIFNDLNITLKDASFVSVIGPSGCGKSTLLNMAAGLEPITGGDILVGETRVRGPGLDRGIVFQQYALFPWLNVIDNVSFGLKSLGMAKDERYEIARRYLRMTGLAEHETYYPAHLSGGMRQRVGICRALAIDPEVLLLDEPFGALDAFTRETMQNALEEICSTARKTVMFITHDIREAVFLSDRVVVLGRAPGGVVMDLPIDLERPRNRHDREFAEYEAMLEKEIRNQMPL